MQFVHLIFVRPIELLLGILFGIFHGASGNYGISLLLMSLSVTLLTLPLYYLAEHWKRADDEIKARMARELRSIRLHYEGQKRFYLTRNVHRLFGYHAGYALKASFGLFVQIPFFFAAYGLLSHHPGLKGTAFLFLQDLGRPDALLGGINLLPFAMTLVNIVSTLAYTRSFSWKRNSQPLLMSFLFLVLLYASPSGLLVYWTTNNLLSLFKNLFFPARRAAYVDDTEPGLTSRFLGGLRGLYGGSLKQPVALLAVLLVVAAQAYWLVEHIASFEYCVAASGAAAALLSVMAAAAAFRHRGWKARLRQLGFLAVPWLAFLPVAYVLVFLRRQNPWVSNENIKFLAVLVLDGAARVACRHLGITTVVQGNVPLGKGSQKAYLWISIAGAASAAAYLFLLSPMQVFLSSPLDVGMSLSALLRGNAPPVLLLVAMVAVVSLYAYKKGTARTCAVAMVALCASVLAFSALSGRRYGILDEFALERADLLEHASLFRLALDTALVWAAITGSRYLLERKRSWAVILAALPLALGLFQVADAARAHTPAAIAAGAESLRSRESGAAGLPPGALEAHRFSTTEGNTIYLIADMFNGNYLGRILEERPELAARLEGFTWYPNALAIGSHTALSLPALYGGWNYEPGLMQSRDRSGLAELREAAQGFYLQASEEGRRVASVDALYADPGAYGVRTLHSDDFTSYWQAQRLNQQDDGSAATLLPSNRKNELLAMLGIFRAAPSWLKPRVYDNGSWILFRSSYQFEYIARKTAATYGYLDLLPELSRAEPATGLFLFIHTQFPHEPYGVRADGSIIQGDFPDPDTRSFVDKRAAYYSARRFMEFLADWMDSLKVLGVYDNTTIVVAADHGNNVDDHDILLPAELEKPLDRANLSRASVLLLAKPQGARDLLQVDERLMSNADAPALLGLVAQRLDLDTRPDVPYYRLQDTWKNFLDSPRAKQGRYDFGLDSEGTLKPVKR